MVTRAMTCAQEQIERIELYVFGDASKNEVCATVHAVARQPSRGEPGFGYYKGSTSKADADHSPIRAGVGTYGNEPYHKRREGA